MKIIFTVVIIVSYILLCVASMDVEGADNWTTEDTQRQLIYSSLLFLDGATTADIHNHDDIEEINPVVKKILGRNPEPTEVAIFVTGVGLAHYAIARKLSPKYRKVWQYIAIGVEAGAVTNNYWIGLRSGF